MRVLSRMSGRRDSSSSCCHRFPLDWITVPYHDRLSTHVVLYHRTPNPLSPRHLQTSVRRSSTRPTTHANPFAPNNPSTSFLVNNANLSVLSWACTSSDLLRIRGLPSLLSTAPGRVKRMHWAHGLNVQLTGREGIERLEKLDVFHPLRRVSRWWITQRK